MSHYREDADILREYPELDPELVRRAEFFGYDGDTVRACQRMNHVSDRATMWCDVETWLHDFGHGHIYYWQTKADAADGRLEKGALWHVITLPGNDLLLGFRDAKEEILYPTIQYVRLSDLASLEYRAAAETVEYEDLTVVPESWRHRWDPEPVSVSEGEGPNLSVSEAAQEKIEDLQS